MSWSKQQREAFERDGVVVLPGVFSDADLAPVIQDISAWIDARARELLVTSEIQDLCADVGFEQRYARLFAQSKAIGRGLDVMYMLRPNMFEFLRNRSLLDWLEPLLGPEISCNPIQHLRAKPPTHLEDHAGPSFHNVPWHQDAGVMMAEGEGSNIVTCWIPLVDVTEAMGCMQVLPGCTEQRYIPHIGGGETRIDPALLPQVPPRALPCNKGDLICMSRFTPHASTPNMTDQCRWSLDLRFQTTGHHTGRTAHPDFVVRSASVMPAFEYADWCAAWTDARKNPRGFAGHRIHQ